MLKEALELHDYLNPALWTKNAELLPEVEDRLNKIISKFQSECMLPLDIVDVHLVGSNASYNYNKYSDLDVHIVVNFDLLDVDKEILMAAYNLQKAQFNRDYDISIHGVNVEMYIEDINAGTMSNGIYSLYNKKWIKKPQKIQYPKLNARFDETVKKLANKIEDTLQNGCSVAVTKMINMLYMMRKNALATDGEFGVGNLIFKEIRNLGLLDQLKHRLKELQSQDLTLERLDESFTAEEDAAIISAAENILRGINGDDSNKFIRLGGIRNEASMRCQSLMNVEIPDKYIVDLLSPSGNYEFKKHVVTVKKKPQVYYEVRLTDKGIKDVREANINAKLTANQNKQVEAQGADTLLKNN